MSELTQANKKTLAIAEFELWLPGELEYSARKAGYDRKIKRAALPAADADSMYGFLSSEWFTFQSMRREGNHYQPYHGKSAQLQLAKFAAGLFDKAALGAWMLSGDPVDEEVFVQYAKMQTEAGPMVLVEAEDQVSQTLEKDFERTLFADGVSMIMDLITSASIDYQHPSEFIREGAKEDLSRLIGCANTLGEYALQCYGLYASRTLELEQLTLPASELAPRTS